LRPEIDKGLKDVLKRQDFILGKDVEAFENEFGAYCGKKFAIGLNSGTDALFLSLKALDIGPSDEVIIPVFTFIATAFAVSYTGAKPVFVDIDPDTCNIDIAGIEKAITKKTKAIIPVHLFGQCADMAAIQKIADKYRLKIIEDACQSHGSEFYAKSDKGNKVSIRKAGAISDCGCFSFYPTKNLGGFGDGGMIVTDDKRVYLKLMVLRDCGRTSRYEHSVIGYNSRLDTLQAAILRIKLKTLDKWNALRIKNAVLYNNILKEISAVRLPLKAAYSSHVYHIYAIQAKGRDALVQHLKNKGIGVMVNYPKPLHLQQAYKALGYSKGDFPVAELVSQEIVSLPMHPFLTGAQIRYVAKIIKEFF
jgi:dTDP-4-amino-4,6-dideoxygalactose transaminase